MPHFWYEFYFNLIRLIHFQQTDYKHRHAFPPLLFFFFPHSLPPCQLSSPVSPVLFLSSNLSIYLVNQSPLFPVTIPLHGYDRCRCVYIYICISGTDLRKAGAGSVYLALPLPLCGASCCGLGRGSGACLNGMGRGRVCMFKSLLFRQLL